MFGNSDRFIAITMNMVEDSFLSKPLEDFQAVNLSWAHQKVSVESEAKS